MTFLSVNIYGVLLHSIVTRFKDIANEPLETTAGSSPSRTWKNASLLQDLTFSHSRQTVHFAGPRRAQRQLL